MNIGFGEHKKLAINLLEKTIHIFEENNIDYYLISGTLLGYVRHNDLIPWDDDIDLIVSSDVLDKLPNINSEIQINKFKNKKFFLKASFKQGIKKHDGYTWPFIDLYTYDKDDKFLYFFNRKWDIKEFEQYKLINFLTINNVRIPKNPHYFLENNYGSYYMTHIKIGKWNHQCETRMSKKEYMLIKKYITLHYKKRISSK